MKIEFNLSLNVFEKWFWCNCVNIVVDNNTREAVELQRKSKRILSFMENKKMMDLTSIRRTRIEGMFNFENKKKRGRLLFVSCPFHVDKTPSMIINESNTVYCFSCQFHGGPIDFFMRLNNIDFMGV